MGARGEIGAVGVVARLVFEDRHGTGIEWHGGGDT